MYTLYGLVVALIVFEIFVIQCNAAASTSRNASKLPDDKSRLPNDIVGRILRDAGLQETLGAGRSRGLMDEARIAMSRFFGDCILVINYLTTRDIDRETQEFHDQKKGQRYLEFGNYKKLMALFQTWGKYARRININYIDLDNDMRRKVNTNIIFKYAKNLTELEMKVRNDSGFWEEISNEQGLVQFPNVKKFTFRCFETDSSNKSVDLHAIFPQLESFKLIGFIRDPKCLKNVENLKELTISETSPPSIPESEFQDIFAKNKQLRKLHISPSNEKTLQSIEKNLENLLTLKIETNRHTVLVGGDKVYNLESVKSLVVVIYETNELIGRPSIKMPNLESLIVRGPYINYNLSNFINHFENLVSVDIKALNGIRGPGEFMERLTHVKECKSTFECLELASLKQFFNGFDKTKSNLISLKLKCLDIFEDGYSRTLKRAMKEINDDLIESDKPTWTLTHDKIVENGEKKYYLKIKRNP